MLHKIEDVVGLGSAPQLASWSLMMFETATQSYYREELDAELTKEDWTVSLRQDIGKEGYVAVCSS